MTIQVERAKRIIEKATRKENLIKMLEEVRRAQRDESIPLKMYYKRSDGQTLMVTAYPIAPLA